MRIIEPGKPVDKKDLFFALCLFVLFLAAYTRTLAPDILYSDSAEFQCLSYTFGITHSTGYPTYLLMGRIIGFLPVNSPAWRISFLSAICAAVTVSGVYLLGRSFTRNRIGAALGSLALGISYTFWSQAVIAEVYTPGMAFLIAVMLLLFRWRAAPERHKLSLLTAALLAGIGFGVHASVWLIGPSAVVFVLMTLRRQRCPRKVWLGSLAACAAGAAAGLAIFMAVFFITDHLNSPTSFIRTTLEPSRIFWGLPAEYFQSPLQRLKMTVISAQWGRSLFPGGDYSALRELSVYLSRLGGLEFSSPLLLAALAGFVVMVRARPALGWFFPLSYLFSLLIILNYDVGDKYVFYLSTYIPLVVAIGAGMGFVLEQIQRYLERTGGRSAQFLYLLPVLLLLTMVIQPAAATRWQAIQSGVAGFVREDYPFPVKNLQEPRLHAQMRLAGIAAENAVLVMDWREMYATAYLAHVEKGLTNMLFFEAMPSGNDGKVASTLVTQLKGYLQEGRPVYVERKFPGLEENFRIHPTAGNMYQLLFRK